jgi:hypothetical protein
MNIKLSYRWLIALTLLAPLACGEGTASDETYVGAVEDDLAAGSTQPIFGSLADDNATSLAVKNGMTLTLQASLAWHMGSAGEEVILKGSTSRDMTFVQGFIPDDAFGTATQLSTRSFQLVLDNPSDINTAISGSPFYLELTTHSSTGDEHWSAQVVLTPRLVPAAGSTTSRLTLGSAVTPVVVNDNPDGVHFRGTVTTTATPQSMVVSSDSTPALVQDSPRTWHFDWDFDHFESAVSRPVQAQAKFGATTSTRSGTLEVRLSKVGLASGQSADDIYGFPECDPGVLACLRTLPASTIDFGACGAYLPVRVCIDTNGFPVP